MHIESNENKAQMPQDTLNCDKLHQACIIDKSGKEVPITRAMIDKSCELLSAFSQFSNQPKTQGL